MRDGMVLQPDAYVSVGSRTTLTGGGWTNIELTSPTPPDEVGFGRTILGESNVWIEAATVAGPFDLAVGWNWFRFDTEIPGLTPPGVFSTHEVYGRVLVQDLSILVPVFSYYHDVDKVGGGYLETEAMFRIPYWPLVGVPIGSIRISAIGGFNLSQNTTPVLTRFQERGMTHVEFEMGTTTGYIPVSLFGPINAHVSFNIALHLQWNLDETTKFRLGTERSRDTWISLGFSWAGPRCEPTRSICVR